MSATKISGSGPSQFEERSPSLMRIMAPAVLYGIWYISTYSIVPNALKFLMGREVNSFLTLETDDLFLYLDAILSIVVTALILALAYVFNRKEAKMLMATACCIFTVRNLCEEFPFVSGIFPDWYVFNVIFNSWLSFWIVLMTVGLVTRLRRQELVAHANSS